jgi:CRISPR-associated exonuclease Cas4
MVVGTALALIPVLVLIGLTALGVYLLARRGMQHERRQLGLAAGAIVAADDSRLAAPTLYSPRLGLVARPDHLLRVGAAIIPVEQKPLARALRPSHVLQVGVQCVLVQELYGKRPPYGIVVLAGGDDNRVAFTPELERHVLRTASEMRGLLRSDAEPGPRWVAAKCNACAFRSYCWG